MTTLGADEDRVAVFVKAPIPGAVKTRLCPPLSAAQAASLYVAFIQDTLTTVRSAAGASGCVCYAAAEGYADLGWLVSDRATPFFLQRGDGLGERLKACFAELFGAGARKAVAIGSDTPHLAPSALREAFAQLDRRDVVLGPAADGGYYLIGLKAPADALFDGVPWSTSCVFSETLRRAERAGLSVGLLPESFDVDTVADLRRLAAADAAMPFTRRVVDELSADGVLAA